MKKKKRNYIPKFFTRKIAVRLFAYMSFNVLFVLLICCIFNAFALSVFYTKEKTNELVSTLYQIEDIYSEDGTEDSQNLMFEKISNDTNIHIVIIDDSNHVAYSSLPEDAIRFEMRLPASISKDGDSTDTYITIEKFKIYKSYQDVGEYFLHIPDRLQPHSRFNGSSSENRLKNSKSKLIRKTDKYEIRNNFNSRLNSFEVVLSSVLKNGYNVRLSLAMSPINDSVKYLNRFLLIIGGISIIISLIPMMFLIRSFTLPIKKLSDIAKNMANLNFDKKYMGHQENEIGELGISINIMSEKLETTIRELKNDLIEKESLDRRRREFLSNVSHELKTPIALIEAYAEGLNENTAMDEADRAYYCEVILDEADKMSNIIQKLMSLMRLESGDDTVDFSDYNINEQISRIISEQKVIYAGDDKLEIDFNPTSDYLVTADEFLIDEVLTNYLTNAIKYKFGDMPIKIYVTELGSDKIQVNVFNATAEPFSEEELLKIWDRFYMADKARTYASGSRGLGLSIVSAIMKAHNCEYGVQNENNGAVFWFTLQSQKI